MTDLNDILSENAAPAPRADLQSRILAAAETAAPANDAPSRRPWWLAGSVAAIAIAAFLVVNPLAPVEDTSEAAEWEQLADASGFGDLYDWVESGDGS